MKKGKETPAGLQSVSCRKPKTLTGLEAPHGVIQGQRVDDVITLALTNLVLYIITSETLSSPLLSHVDPSPCNKLLLPLPTQNFLSCEWFILSVI